MSFPTLYEACRKVVAKGVVVSIERHYDEDGYMVSDHYGKWSDTPRTTVYGDRKLGILRGGSHTYYETFKTEDEAEDRIAELDEDNFGAEIVWTPTRVYYQVVSHPTQRDYLEGVNTDVRTHNFSKLFETEREYDDWRDYMRRTYGYRDSAWTILRETRKEWKIEVYGDKILSRDGFTNNYDHHSFRYWIPTNDYLKHEWNHVSQADREGVMTKYLLKGKTEREIAHWWEGYHAAPEDEQAKAWERARELASIDYYLQDWKRIEGLISQDWGYCGVEATVSWNGEEIASASVWGCESDGGDEYFDELEQDVLYEALQEAPKHFHHAHKYLTNVEVPPEVVALTWIAGDELKALHKALKSSSGPWGGGRGWSSSNLDLHDYLGDLDDEEQALYDGVEPAGEDEEHADA